MRVRLLAVALTVALSSLVFAGSPPTWDKVMSPSSRFKSALGGAATIDKETGLVRQTAPTTNNFVSFSGAQAACYGLVVGGRAG